MTAYFDAWYARNKETLAAARKLKRATNKAYANLVKSWNKNGRDKRRQERELADAARLESQEPEEPVVAEGPYTSQVAARLLGCSRHTLRAWVDKGVIPAPARRGNRGPYLYSAADLVQIKQVLQERGWHSRTVKPLSETTPGQLYEVRTGTGVLEQQCLFRVGMLARVLGRAPGVIEQWEHEGMLPVTPLRAEGSAKQRLYTRAQIECVLQVWNRYGCQVAEEQYRVFYVDVLQGWIDSGVYLLTLLESPRADL